MIAVDICVKLSNIFMIIFSGMTNAEVLHQVEHGYRMPCPPGCPQALYDIMLECWKKDENDRPTFETLQWKLEEFFTLPGSEYNEAAMIRWCSDSSSLPIASEPATPALEHGGLDWGRPQQLIARFATSQHLSWTTCPGRHVLNKQTKPIFLPLISPSFSNTNLSGSGRWKKILPKKECFFMEGRNVS